mmetsp:Transcript_14097/g.32040  ORF Transcript_14097/g.32040 Transcript_14097/m.32040 type:complete len:250 (-) Transcript_14097:190-939(-)
MSVEDFLRSFSTRDSTSRIQSRTGPPSNLILDLQSYPRWLVSRDRGAAAAAAAGWGPPASDLPSPHAAADLPSRTPSLIRRPGASRENSSERIGSPQLPPRRRGGDEERVGGTRSQLTAPGENARSCCTGRIRAPLSSAARASRFLRHPSDGADAVLLPRSIGASDSLPSSLNIGLHDEDVTKPQSRKTTISTQSKREAPIGQFPRVAVFIVAWVDCDCSRYLQPIRPTSSRVLLQSWLRAVLWAAARL